MKRFILIAALCLPVAGLATTFDGTDEEVLDIVEIRVAEKDMAKCEQTLRTLRQKPVVTDSGFQLPNFMRNDDLPTSVCVVDA
ncbi:hypothetical protein SAMN05421666_1053 [Roseovarius nanhaiticus]|uniref:Uncharacterized protein n=1 Tax=Roseovarius nanhaiticus TaxID=573024 RepID=A0A1N7FHZ3_9RHOB|nr:hypothetical protein [Roseovarius nanhaiticus]SEK54255.1 hypothetical protein SAMN05216208_1083 [Roseovarius nanhaiticus]SIR99855.1 hypothetical protein SAMN05421666_1053 [Roseovarius nanhaiticus]